MDKHIVELYSDAELGLLERRIKRWRIALWGLAAAALAACVGMTALTNTGNAAGMEIAVITVSTLGGWIFIYGRSFVVTAGRRELGHALMLRQEERQRVEGTVTVTGERIVIRRSITARRVEVIDSGKTTRLLVCESRAGKLAAAGAVTLYSAHGYVAAYEVAQ